MQAQSFLKNLLPLSKFFPWQDAGQGVLGIDFGSSSLKIVELKKKKERATLMTYGELALGPYGANPVGRPVRLVDDKARQAISDLSKEASSKSKDVAVVVPLRSSFVTVVEMPVMSEKELSDSIKFEAKKYIPIPLSEVAMDWWVIPEGFENKEEKKDSDGDNSENKAIEKKMMSVLLVAIHRDAIDKYKDLLSGAGLNVKGFEIEVFSAVRALIGRDLSPLLLVDFGASSTKVTVVDYGIVRMTYSFDRGGQTLSEALARAMGVDFARAEETKRQVGLSSRPEHSEISSVINPLVDHQISEVERVMLDYRRKSGRSVSRAILYGGGAGLGGLVERSANKLGIEVSLGEPFGKVEYPSFMAPAFKEIGPTFAVSLGSALRELK